MKPYRVLLGIKINGAAMVVCISPVMAESKAAAIEVAMKLFDRNIIYNISVIKSAPTCTETAWEEKKRHLC